jgi:hypothetical protein
MSTLGLLGIICLVPLIMGGFVLLLDYIVEKEWIRNGRPTIDDYIRKIVNEEMIKHINLK